MASRVSDFLRFKWRNAFRVFDANKDGELTVDDYIQIADNISKLTGATEEQAEKTRKEWAKYFRFYKQDPSIRVDASRYVETHVELYNDVKSFKDLVNRTASDLFDRMDLNGDEFISLDEFVIFYEAIGIHQQDVTTKHFKKLDGNSDGLLQREEFLEEVVRYFFDPDPETGVSYFLPQLQESDNF